MKFKYFYEATRKPPQKVVDPALMSFKDYYNNYANPKNEWHDSGSYDTTVKGMNKWGNQYDSKNLVRRFNVNDRNFELHRKSEDRWDNQYVKTDDDGEIVRIGNEVQYLSPEEKQKLIPEDKRYDHQFNVYDVTDGEPVLVGNTLNEWGALLVQVAQEYRNFGLGTMLVKAKRDVDPTVDSGGVTPSGHANLKRVHSEMVREYLRDGIYTELIKQGVLTKDQVKEIVGGLTDKPKKDNKKLNTSNPEDMLVMTDDGQSHVIIYNKNIFDQDFDEHDSDFWAKKFVKGSLMLGGFGGNVPFISRLHGSDKAKAFMIEMILNGNVGERLRLDDEEAKLMKAKLGDKLKVEPYGNETDDDHYYIEEPTMGNMKGLGKAEEKYRKSRDQYDEWYYRIQEMGDAFGQSQAAE